MSPFWNEWLSPQNNKITFLGSTGQQCNRYIHNGYEPISIQRKTFYDIILHAVELMPCLKHRCASHELRRWLKIQSVNGYYQIIVAAFSTPKLHWNSSDCSQGVITTRSNGMKFRLHQSNLEVNFLIYSYWLSCTSEKLNKQKLKC